MMPDPSLLSLVPPPPDGFEEKRPAQPVDGGATQWSTAHRVTFVTPADFTAKVYYWCMAGTGIYFTIALSAFVWAWQQQKPRQRRRPLLLGAAASCCALFCYPTARHGASLAALLTRQAAHFGGLALSEASDGVVQQTASLSRRLLVAIVTLPFSSYKISGARFADSRTDDGHVWPRRGALDPHARPFRDFCRDWQSMLRIDHDQISEGALCNKAVPPNVELVVLGSPAVFAAITTIAALHGTGRLHAAGTRRALLSVVFLCAAPPSTLFLDHPSCVPPAVCPHTTHHTPRAVLDLMAMLVGN